MLPSTVSGCFKHCGFVAPIEYNRPAKRSLALKTYAHAQYVITRVPHVRNRNIKFCSFQPKFRNKCVCIKRYKFVHFVWETHRDHK